MQSECDPHVWSQIESMVRQRLAPPSDAMSASSPSAAADSTAAPLKRQ